MADLIHPRVRKVLETDQGILDAFGMEVLEAQEGRCRMRLEVPAHLVNASGFAHGSIAFSILDTGCAYALGSLEVRGVTINANTTFVRGAQAGSELQAEIVVVSQSKRLATLRGEMFLVDGGERTLAAHGTFVFQLIVPRVPSS